MMTAQEFLNQSKNIDYSKITGANPQLSVLPFIEADMIEFAKLHLIEQTEAILKVWELSGGYNNVEKNIIQNTYPLKNVK